MWGRLARSMAPYHQKVQSLRTKAWASCLYGIASVHLGEEHFEQLRTEALQGLGEHSPGTSPPVHLSLVENVHTDPQLLSSMPFLPPSASDPMQLSQIVMQAHQGIGARYVDGQDVVFRCGGLLVAFVSGTQRSKVCDLGSGKAIASH